MQPAWLGAGARQAEAYFSIKDVPAPLFVPSCRPGIVSFNPTNAVQRFARRRSAPGNKRWHLSADPRQDKSKVLQDLKCGCHDDGHRAQVVCRIVSQRDTT